MEEEDEEEEDTMAKTDLLPVVEDEGTSNSASGGDGGDAPESIALIYSGSPLYHCFKCRKVFSNRPSLRKHVKANISLTMVSYTKLEGPSGRAFLGRKEGQILF